ncbi:head GIN domain-containing protein [Maribacter algicola]|uniref:Head GIN domain-containing protein n=1 Tax=Meishania litoralis TaxID=3434685 RepID=A0ACC7LMV4_9FLAO
MVKLEFYSLYNRVIASWMVLLIFLLFVGCNTDSAPDCFQTSGDLVRKEISVPDFSKITVFEKVGLVLKQGDEQKVEIETGENLFEDVSALVQDGRLILRNENACNLFREYGITKVYVTAPNITEIRSSTGLAIESDGVLSYPDLELLSESFLEPDAETTDGEFDLQLDSQNVSVVVNGIAYFKLKGAVDNLSLIIAAGDSRIEAQNVTAQNVTLDHRGSNDMSIDPQVSIRGVIRGNGDVISSNRPSTVEVEELFKGKLIFKD